jgi:hypothetical protein
MGELRVKGTPEDVRDQTSGVRRQKQHRLSDI